MKKFFTLFFLITVILNSNAQTGCNPATLTNVEHEGSGNRITWTMPTGGEEVTISQGGDFSNNSIGDKSSFGVYHRFTLEDLATINNGVLTQVIFAPAYRSFQIQPGHNYTIQIYKGGKWGAEGDRNPGTLIASQGLNNANLLFNQENSVTLETPLTIDASQELWIGYFCTNIDSVQSLSKYPAGVDNGPCKNGFGNIMFYENQWWTFCELDDNSDINFCIKGKVQTIEGASVNIYCNEDKIKSNVEGTTFLHNNPTGEEQCYKVEVNCLEGGVSPLSNEICIKDNGIRDRSATFSIYPNPAGNELRVKSYELRDMSVEIYDVFGRLQKAESRKQNAEGTMVVDISNLAAGIYFIKLIDENCSAVQRFIKE